MHLKGAWRAPDCIWLDIMGHTGWLGVVVKSASSLGQGLNAWRMHQAYQNSGLGAGLG